MLALLWLGWLVFQVKAPSLQFQQLLHHMRRSCSAGLSRQTAGGPRQTDPPHRLLSRDQLTEAAPHQLPPYSLPLLFQHSYTTTTFLPSLSPDIPLLSTYAARRSCSLLAGCSLCPFHLTRWGKRVEMINPQERESLAGSPHLSPSHHHCLVIPYQVNIFYKQTTLCV